MKFSIRFDEEHWLPQGVAFSVTFGRNSLFTCKAASKKWYKNDFFGDNFEIIEYKQYVLSIRGQILLLVFQ